MAQAQVPHIENFMLALTQAVSKDQTTLSQMQITDSKSTMLSTKIEENIYAYWNAPGTPGEANSGGPLWNDQYEIKYYANEAHAGDKNASSMVTEWQEQYSEDSAKSQSAESQQDGAVQAGQGQTSADAQNLEMKASMIQAVTSIQTALSSILSQGITA